MKLALFTMNSCVLLLISGHAFAWVMPCREGNMPCREANVEVDTVDLGGVSLSSYETPCQCTDPLCDKPMYTNCISRAYCCEAFGNIGAR